MPRDHYVVLVIVALLAAAITLGLIHRVDDFDLRPLSLTSQDVESFASEWGAWSALASILLMILHSFVPLPAEVIAIANGMMFGPFWGIVITWTGATLGATSAFALARRLGRPIGRRFVSAERWQAVENWKAHPSTLLMVRLIPVISFNLVNYAAGVTGIRWWDFLWTTALGILPVTIASVVLGDRLLELSWPVWLVLAVGILVVWLVLRAISMRLPRLRVGRRSVAGPLAAHGAGPTSVHADHQHLTCSTPVRGRAQFLPARGQIASLHRRTDQNLRDGS